RSGHLTLVNQDAELPGDFVPYNLVRLSLRSVSGPHELRKEAALALEALFEQAQSEGYELYVKSSYRSYQTQSTKYYNRLEKYGKDDGVVAKPGTSDHQTGLGVDVLNREWANREGMTPAFGETAEAKWLEANCARFGFIIRYLPDKQEITKIIYEPGICAMWGRRLPPISWRIVCAWKNLRYRPVRQLRRMKLPAVISRRWYAP
ncbi:MAG TPA: M15 family metallopeptidase, partial [Clostridia bacterium]|nr:M15 family metallopeptidase [Clostridia bacterium]